MLRGLRAPALGVGWEASFSSCGAHPGPWPLCPREASPPRYINPSKPGRVPFVDFIRNTFAWPRAASPGRAPFPQRQKMHFLVFTRRPKATRSCLKLQNQGGVVALPVALRHTAHRRPRRPRGAWEDRLSQGGGRWDTQGAWLGPREWVAPATRLHTSPLSPDVESELFG